MYIIHVGAASYKASVVRPYGHCCDTAMWNTQFLPFVHVHFHDPTVENFGGDTYELPVLS